MEEVEIILLKIIKIQFWRQFYTIDPPTLPSNWFSAFYSTFITPNLCSIALRVFPFVCLMYWVKAAYTHTLWITIRQFFLLYFPRKIDLLEIRRRRKSQCNEIQKPSSIMPTLKLWYWNPYPSLILFTG